MDKLDTTNPNELNSISINEAEENEEIQTLIDINQLSESDSFIERSHEEKWSYYEQKPICQIEWEKRVQQAVTPIAEDNPYKLLQEGEIASIDAVGHKEGSYGLDSRPKILDKSTNKWTLLDSGSCVSCFPKGPEDAINPDVNLRSVNGGLIKTYGTRKMSLQIGRKCYNIEGIIADVPQQIFGWDIFEKYKLSLDWNEWGDLILKDRKSQISTVLRHELVPHDSVPRIKTVESIEVDVNAQAYFEMQCMQKVDAISIDQDEEAPFFIDNLPLPEELDPDSANDKLNLEALKKLEPKYASIVKKYQILKTKFDSNPKHSVKHVIDTGDASPIKCKVRPILANSDKSIQGRRIWEEMLKMGVIERVDPATLTQWASPLHLAKKPNSNSYRPCIDFRLINRVTKSDHYPIPTLKSFTKNLRGSKFFSVIDLRSAFFNLPIHEDSISKTTVLSPWGGAFAFRRLPFGLKNGPSSWQKFLDNCLSGISNIYTYLDDILVHNVTEEDHINTLHQIFQKLEQNGLSLALDKCVFGKSEVDYLGYRVTSSGIRPLSRKIEAVTKIPPPTSQKELLHFLGALNYFRSSLRGFVKNGKYNNAANLLQPLYSVGTVKIPTKQKFQEIWSRSPYLQEAFADAKRLLKEAAELAHMDPNLPLELFTDSSDHSIGAVLMQKQNQKYVPLGYFSRHLPVEKSNWATYRKELLAAQSGLRYFISDIYGKHCTIWTDHMPLVKAYEGNGFQLHDPVAQRALMEISQFTKDIRHIAGVKNCGSDYFSRIPQNKLGSIYDSAAIMEGHKLETISPKVILESQMECDEIEQLKQNPNRWSDLSFGEVDFNDSKLYCELSGAQPRPYLPKPLRRFVIEQLHNGLDHAGEKESKRRIAAYYYWSGIKNDVVKYVQSCHGCQSTKSSKLKPPHIGQFDVPDQRFSHIHLDIVGPLPPSKGYKYLLTIKCRTTRFVQCVPLVNPTSENIADAFMLHWTSIFGLPTYCTSDQGANLTSGLFKGLQENLGIEVKYSPIYHPQSNGMIERSHQSIKNSLKAKLIEMGDTYQDKWIYYLPWALLGIRSAYNKNLGTSSAEMTLGLHPQLPGTVLADPEDINSTDSHMESILKKLQIKNNRAAVPTNISVKKSSDPLPTSVTHVYVRQYDIKGLSSKYVGPFKITSRPSRSTVEIRVGTNKDGSERREIRHISDTKIAYLRDDAVEASRPKRGRPPKPKPRPEPQPDPTPPSAPTKADISTNKNDGIASRLRSRNLPNVAEINFSVPPPGWKAGNSNYLRQSGNSVAWSANQGELEEINRSISSSCQN